MLTTIFIIIFVFCGVFIILAEGSASKQANLPHANTDLRKAQYIADPEVERVKRLRSHSTATGEQG
jgi:hypothetical protein